jgi:hypothetical protein
MINAKDAAGRTTLDSAVMSPSSCIMIGAAIATVCELFMSITLVLNHRQIDLGP